MTTKPANLRTRRNGKRWFVVSAWAEEGLADPLPIFATDPATAGRIAIAALDANRVHWTRVRAWAATDHSLDWEEWR